MGAIVALRSESLAIAIAPVMAVVSFADRSMRFLRRLGACNCNRKRFAIAIGEPLRSGPRGPDRKR
eukprot:791528-Alexandrium_andersonii.AAC.1